MLRLIFLLELYTAVIWSEDIPDITLLVPKPTYSYYYHNYETTLQCISNGNATLSAMTWSYWDKTDMKSEAYFSSSKTTSSDFDCNINFQDCRDWRLDKWFITHSLESNFGPVTDYRWESFPVYTTSGEYEFLNNIPIPRPTDPWNIPVSLRGSSNGYILLCEGPNPFRYSCYWIILGGWNQNKKAAIRKCVGGVPSSGFPKGDCQKILDSHDGFQLSDKIWKHVIVHWDPLTGEALVSAPGKYDTILQYKDNDFLKITHVSFRSSNRQIQWRFHIYNFFTTTEHNAWLTSPWFRPRDKELCVKFLYHIPTSSEGNKLIVTYFDGVNTKLLQEVQSNKGQWNEAQLVLLLDEIRPSQITFSTVTGNESPVSNDSFSVDVIRECDAKGETRVLETKIPEKSLKSENPPSCQLLQFPDWTVTPTVVAKGETGCAEGMFTTACSESCETFLGKEHAFCQNTVICKATEEGKRADGACVCSSGFTGEYCENVCPAYKYGPSCSKTCGNCRQNEVCDGITGICPDGCYDGYTTQFCNTSLPVLNNPPEIYTILPDRVTLVIHVDNFRGDSKPTSFQIQYRKKQQNTWSRDSDIVKYQPQETSVTALLLNLEPSTQYELRVVLFDAEGNSYELQDVPIVPITTGCNDRNILEVIEGVHNITIKFDSADDTRYLCSENMYQATAQPGNHIGKFDSKSQSILITSLEAYTNYSVTVERKATSKQIYNGNILTLQTGPEKVLYLQVTDKSSTSLQISWEAPAKTNGIIKTYKVLYKHLGYKACKFGQKFQNTSAGSYDWREPPIKIDNLIPYSYYELTVYGFTVENGEPNTITVETKGTDMPEVVPVFVSNRPVIYSTEALFQWKDFENCEDQRGGIEKYMIILQGASDWVLQFNKVYHIRLRTLTIDNLIPYTYYNLSIIGMRPGTGATNLKKALNTTFQTQDGALAEVRNLTTYSKGKNWISLRWSKPYPPYGEIEGYLLDYYNTQTRNNRKTVKVVGEPCTLWDNLICETISNLDGKIMYTIEVKAFNMKNKGAQHKLVQATTVEEAPTAPIDLKIEDQPLENSVHLSWLHPDKSNGKLVEFQIQRSVKETWLLYHKNDSSPSVKFEITEEQKHYNHTVNNLQPSTVYMLNISAITVAKGPPITIQVETPLADIATHQDLEVIEFTNTTLTLKLPEPHKYLTNMSAYFIVLASDSDKGLPTDMSVFNDTTLKQELIQQAGMNKYKKHLIAAEVKPENREFTIGNNITSKAMKFGSGYRNEPLKPETVYSVAIVVLNSQRKKRSFDVVKLSGNTITLKQMSPLESESSNLGLLALLILALIPILIFLFIKNRARVVSILNKPNQPLTVKLQAIHGEETLIQKTPISEPELEINDSLPPIEKPLSQRLSRRVMISELENYVRIGMSTGELATQHALFPRGQTKPWHYGRLPQNKSKNRYGNLVAYDETRVILKKMPDDEYSDYINANYIDGYKSNKFYIATQGPKPNTVDDFWRMVWQEQVLIICMLANVIENGKKKCEQYWPDLGKEKMYGVVSVLTATVQVFADFTFRQLNITCKGKKRKVMHLHFTSWPDHGVPFYPQSVAEFLKKLLATPHGPGPILVHCSAGVGRTGTIILTDICLRMAAAEGAVDILGYLQAIRDQRPNMVDNMEQYKFVHLVLLDCLVEEPTCYACHDLDKVVSELKKQGILKTQYQRLQKLSQHDRTLRRNTLGNDIERAGDKDRYPDIVPGMNGRVFLPRFPPEDLNSDYINAVFVDGFRAKDQFIATQLPLPNTVGDFWRLVSEKSVPIIVVLNELDLHNKSLQTCQFWPGADECLSPTAHLSVKLKQQSHVLHWSLITLQVTDDGSIPGPPKQQVVRLIQVHNWSSESNLPLETGMLLELWNEIERLYSGKGPILLTCLNGVTGCGLLLALSFVIEKIKLEQQCDVCHAVRTIRQNREQFITTQEQFEFLYDAAITYLDAFQTYANFS